jgi:hypothetical protein
MSTIGIRIAIVVLATAALSAAACAAPSRGGGGGHGGGGGMHAGGGGGGMRGGGMRGGGGGGARFSGRAAVSRSYARPSSGGGNVARSTFVGNRSAATGNPAGTGRFNVKLDSTVKSNAVRETLNSHLVAGALRSPTALRNPGSRARITASAATAGWHRCACLKANEPGAIQVACSRDAALVIPVLGLIILNAAPIELDQCADWWEAI